jgi:integrase
MSNLKKTKKPSKPYRSFPLTAHNNGQWCKKIHGRVLFFGVWADPQAAFDDYLRRADDLHAGRRPSTTSTISANGVTVKDVCNHFLTYQLNKTNNGEITARWFAECRKTADKFAQFVGSARLVSDLVPEDFLRFRQRLVSVGFKKTGKGLGVHALARAISVIREIFKYAWELDLLDKPIKYGKALEKPSVTLVRKSRQVFEQKSGKRIFDVGQIHAMLKAAGTPLDAMILLAINAGYGNTDCAQLPTAVVDLEKGLIDYGRNKTGIERIAPLWPETVLAMKQTLANRPKPFDKESEQLFFLTPAGLPWIRERIDRVQDESAIIKKVVITDDLCRKFSQLLVQLDTRRKGVGFYALRHTFRTFADEVKDQHAVLRIMGHTIPGMSGIYVETIGLDRLIAVTEHVRKKLFGEPSASPAEVPGPVSAT